jgi:hypothetical protein
LRHRIIDLCLIICSDVFESVMQNSGLCSDWQLHTDISLWRQKFSHNAVWLRCVVNKVWLVFIYAQMFSLVSQHSTSAAYSSITAIAMLQQTWTDKLYHKLDSHLRASLLTQYMNGQREGRLVFNGAVVCPGTITEYFRKNKTIL